MKHFDSIARGTLALICLLFLVPCLACGQVTEIDQQRLLKEGIRTLQGKHITIYTDVRDREDVDELCEVFDKAIPQWCKYFDVPEKETGDWHITACVMVEANRESFEKAGLFPRGLPPFPAGYQQGNNVWAYVQDGDYYTRHLLLHEGTHAFMQKFLGGYGPPWYAEGMAEWLGLHRWQDGVLEIGKLIKSSEEASHWGRVKLLREDFESGFQPTLVEFMQTPNESFRNVNSYAWAWAICELMGRHPQYQDAFVQMKDAVHFSPAEFNRTFYNRLGADAWKQAEAHWQLMSREIVYGYDVIRNQPVAAAVQPTENGHKISLAADRGWQSTGIEIDANREYQLVSEGTYVVKNDGEDWESTADGVTIEYFRGKPLGTLVATIVPGNAESPMSKPITIGTSGKLLVEESGELYLRINDSPAELHDNRGQLEIRISPVSD